MNRIIKFRAWDERLNKYIDLVEITLEGEAVSHDYEGMHAEDVILEQYTGFKDCGNTGKEIYHNDIFPKGGLVEWVWGGWHVKFPTYFISLYEYIYNDMHRKVIGNIHANKELLQSKE